jgi:proteic killer suppression protein
VIRTFRSRALRALWYRRDGSRLHGPVDRIERVLFALNNAVRPEDMNVPGWHFHELGGDREGVYSIRITANWRITFEWDKGDAIRVDYEDYH